ncbi:hypothetical protein ACQBAU_07450 [Propionibacteriaceae bacterium Y2011]|uniref:hypothetical protein n=1 Tax=Microlunatus sp. Y2014 TaxID=3418488 RepID=UPI003B4D281B
MIKIAVGRRFDIWVTGGPLEHLVMSVGDSLHVRGSCRSFPGSELVKGAFVMWTIMIAMLVILGLCLAVVLMVTLGIEGLGKGRHPELADRLARYAKHLNGDAEPPKKFENLLQR